jgi:hypothetical protein
LGDGGFGLAIVPEVCCLLAGVPVVRGMLGMGVLGLLLLLLLLLLLSQGPLQRRVRAEGRRQRREDTGPAQVSRRRSRVRRNGI